MLRRYRAERSALAAVMLALALVGCRSGDGSVARLENGRFLEVQDGLPVAWHPVVWVAAHTRFEHEPPEGSGESGVLRIKNEQPNDARLCQTVAIEPGATYRVSATARTEDVGVDLFGALITIEPRAGDSRDLRGTQPWQQLEVTAAAGDRASWDVCLRLGSYANLNTGTAYFRDVNLEVVARSTGWAPSVPSDRAAFLRTALASPLVAAPLGGLLLAYGFGILGNLAPRARRRRRPDGRDDEGA